MEYQKKEIRIFQNGRTVNDQFYIDGDYNVPEAKRDVEAELEENATSDTQLEKAKETIMELMK